MNLSRKGLAGGQSGATQPFAIGTARLTLLVGVPEMKNDLVVCY
jgi:hypothetical protein